MILAPSILSADFGILAEQIKKCENAGAKWLHIDVMDGHFVPNISFAMPVIKSIRKYTDMYFDVHLMITEPERYINDFIDAGADSVTFHIEATHFPDRCIEMIRQRGKAAGIAINPQTPVDKIIPYVEKVDMVLVMSVEPGYGGQSYITSVNDKLKFLREIKGDYFNIEVDGGICDDTIDMALSAGANVIVAGTAVFNGDIEENIKRLWR